MRIYVRKMEPATDTTYPPKCSFWPPFLHSPGTWAHSTTTYDRSKPNSCMLSSHMSQREHPVRGEHALGMTKWSEENWQHANACKIKIPLFQCFLPYVVMSRGFISKSCLNRGLNLIRVHLISAPYRFLADCSVSASVGIMWCSACPQSCQSWQSLGWEMVRAE